MSSLSLGPVADRHVVFPDLLGDHFGIVNFAPRRQRHVAIDAAGDLSDIEERSLRWLFEQAGLDLDHYRPQTLKRRIGACLRALRIERVEQLQPAIERHPILLEKALGAMVIGVTSFFRDGDVFAALRDMVIPDLLSRQSRLRIWSAGCSDGAELYSLAMLLDQHGALPRCLLLGTDCRADALARAREGRYDASALKDVPGELLARYFQPEPGAWQVRPFLRACAQWRRGDVMKTLEPGAWDLVLCRNLAIYLEAACSHELWLRLQSCLRPGGILVLGKAERPSGARLLAPIGPSIYRRRRS